MKLTEKEQKICDIFSQKDETGKVHCFECPLSLVDTVAPYTCYATIDGRTEEAKKLKRWK